jgi:myo-inositol 2-dehydrogenase/D-chiro-inositol 1-dehydrogenase
VTTHDLRVGIIGVGMMGADHADRLARRTAGARLVAVSDPDTARAEALAGQYDGVRTVADPLELVADEGVDAVLVASPGFAHEPQLMACLEHGKAVLCEKPLTMDSESSLRVVEAERAGGRPLITVGFMRRFDPEYARLKELLDAGSIGAPLVLHQHHRNKAVPDSFRSEMIVRDSLVHEVDVARFLLGEEIVSIQVLTPRSTSLAPSGVADPQVTLFTMAGGAVVTNEVFVNCAVGYEVRCEVVGERGTAIAGRPWGDLYTTAASGTWGGAVPPDFRVRFERAYDLEVQAWVDASRRGEVVGATAYDGYASTVVCTAGMESLETGQPVDIKLETQP